MDEQVAVKKSPFVAFAFVGLGVLLVLLGSVVIVGWYLQSTTLIQISPSFAPMQFNTALGFLLSGVGLLALSVKQKVFAGILGVLLAILGGFTLIQYMTGVDFGIDQIFMDHYITVKTSHPGRMAPNTAICFFLTALALVLSGHVDNKRWVQAMAGALMVFALLSFLGYVSGSTDLYGWGTLTRMALHTTVGFFLASVALFLYVFRQKSEVSFNFWDAAPIISFVVLINITFFAWYSGREIVQQANNLQFLRLVEDSEDILEERYSHYEQALFGGLGLIKASEKVNREEWRIYVETLDVDKRLPGINGVGYIDYVEDSALEGYLEEMRVDNSPNFVNRPDTDFSDKFVIRYSEPVYRNKTAIGLDIGFEANRRRAAEKARDTALPALTQKIELVQDNKKRAGFLLLVPTYEGGVVPDSVEGRREHIRGWVYAPFIGENFLRDLSGLTGNQIVFTVYDGNQKSPDQVIYSSAESVTDTYNSFAHDTSLAIAGNVWTISWQASPYFVPKQSDAIPMIVFLVGLALTALISGVLFLLAKMNGHTASVLSENRERLRAVVEGAVDGLITIDGQGNVESFNRACEEIFGYREKEVLGQNIKILMPEPYHSEHDGYLKNYRDTGDKKIIGIGREVEGQRKDGTVFPLDLSISEIYVQGQKLYSGIVRDITARKQAEDEIMRSNEELERFAYIASHDLQEPLRMVSNFTGLLKEEYGGKMDKQASQYMDFVVDASSRMQNLVSDLLDYSRVGVEDVGFSEFESQNQVDFVVENLKEAIEETQAKVTVDPMPTLYASPVRFSRLVQNLVGNSIKYRAQDKAPEIHIAAEEQEDFWLFSIRDNGIGINEDYLEQIFVLFKRLHNKNEYSGTGIGLAVCKKIVESFGGKLWVESELEKGSIFYFTVPKHGKLKDVA